MLTRSDAMVTYHSVSPTMLLTLFLAASTGCAHRAATTVERKAPDKTVAQVTLSAPMPWLQQSPALWQRDFSLSPRDSSVPLPKADLAKESIGTMTRVYNLFNRWALAESLRANRGTQFVDITDECKGKIELDFALTPEQWAKPENRVKYYRAVNDLIEKIGNQLITDMGDSLVGPEKELFLHALKTLAWQESKWQHYLRYKDWFFVLVSGGSYNKLDDWGITQVARSSFDPKVLLNKNFFDSQGYCSISSSLYYGFMEYYFCYMEARRHPGNGPSLFNKIVGAYNRYCSGYSACWYELATYDEGYRNYQIRAMGGFKDNFVLKPWEKELEPEGAQEESKSER